MAGTRTEPLRDLLRKVESMHKQNVARAIRAACAVLVATGLAGTVGAQESGLPAAPPVHLLVAAAGQSPAPSAQDPAQNAQTDAAQTNVTRTSNTQPAGLGPKLTIDQAEQMAIRNNPNVSVAHLLALAQAQVTREVRSAEMPAADADLTAADAHLNSRITAGALNNPIVYERAAGGLTVRQLITDFGRTHNLVKSAQSNARAQFESERATALDIKLTADQAFYQALTAQAVLRVAQQTVAQRQATGDQVAALTKSKIKSDLDLSFANVQISQADLMLVDAKSDEQSAMAALNDVLGSEADEQYTLMDETDGNPPPAPQDPEPLVQTAMQARPDLAALNDQFTAARQYSTAERDQWMPTVSAIAAAGGTPVRADQIQSSWYGAAGANVSIPIFNGFLFNAQEKEAKLRAQADQERVRNLRNQIARDVRTTVLNAQAAFERIGVTQGMLSQADLALDLAQARYKIGLSSIVELTQAQLSQTEAEIAYTSARYAYQTALAEVRYQLGQ
jgi:outer membrane protein